MVLSICPQRQIFRPVRRNGHEPTGFFQGTLTDGHFNDHGVSLIVLSWTETGSLLPEPDGHLSMYPALQLPMCKVFEVSRSGYYAWRERQQKETTDQWLVDLITACQRQSRQTYGIRRVRRWIQRQNGKSDLSPILCKLQKPV